MNGRINSVLKIATDESLTKSQREQLVEIASQLSNVFPNHESALLALARIASITEFDKDAPKESIDIETRFFEILFLISNWSEETKLGFSKFMATNSRIARIINASISMQASAAGTRGPKGKPEKTKKKYLKAEEIFKANPKIYGGYGAHDAAITMIEKYPNENFSKRKLQSLIPLWKSEISK